MTCYENCHQFIQEVFTRWMIGKERVTIHKVQFTLAWMRKTEGQIVNVLGRVEAEQIIQPSLDRVPLAIPDWLIKACLHQGPASTKVTATLLLMGDSDLVLFAETLEQFD